MINKMINGNDKEMMFDYIRRYGSKKFKDISGFLGHWEKAKFQNGFLGQLMGGELILEKEVCVKKDKNNYEREMNSFLYDDGDFKENSFPHKLEMAFRQVGNDYMYCRVGDLITVNSLIENNTKDFLFYRSDNEKIIDLPNGKKITLKGTEKLFRVLRKIAIAFDLEESYEEFRIAHSMILNDSELKGTLCLSIHPMDFLTMSDNAANWSSCMSWTEDGCYKVGSMEMLTASNVLIAYMKSNTSNFSFKNEDRTHEWNSKKWRELVIVTPEVIINSRSYPYQQDALTGVVLNWVAELAEKNTNLRYEKEVLTYKDHFNIEFEGFMYNDFHNNDSSIFKYIKQVGLDERDIEDIFVDGYSVCLECLGTLDREDDFVCFECQDIRVCLDCGEILRPTDNRVQIPETGDYYCQRCWEYGHEKHTCFNCGRTITNTRKIYYHKDEDPCGECSGVVYLCNSCYYDFRERDKLYWGGPNYAASLYLPRLTNEELDRLKNYKDCVL